MAKRAKRLDPAVIRQYLEVQDREPFRDLLCKVLQAQPTRESIREFAQQKPDRWTHMCYTMARLAGYSTKNIVEGNLSVQINQMSDLELDIKLEELKEKFLAEDTD